MDCVIHIGTEKTGTTSIQRTLDEGADLLLCDGTLWPPVFRDGQDPRIACYAMDDAALDLRKRRRGLTTPEAVTKFRTQFENRLERELAAAPGARTLLIVNEHLSRMRARSEPARLKALLDGFASRIRIVLYLRRQDLMMRSMYSQVIKVGGTRENVFPLFEQEEEGDFTTFNYRRIVDLWAGTFGREALEIRVFERPQLVEGDVIADFFHTVGLARPDGLQAAKSNENLSPEALLSLRELNRHLPREARGNLGPLSARIFTGPGMPVERAKAEEFLSHFQQDNDDVARRYLGRDRLFEPIGEGEYPETVEPASLEVSAQTVAWHFARLWEGRNRKF
ncbi:hypothetical protein [Roseovarius atlanticus]|uniref:hypothetical protein n=1 Tax=Roseovarius atlanticus TaxID=1641875 RepID=UPI001C9809AE|nr:hypothetical protein [Roseovarius atlanticus]MBY6127060.1 hypothetical protein [Roseovarius atlanticus]MBY6151554.1 hypothetical protein [Roseovarius atlanticus]